MLSRSTSLSQLVFECLTSQWQSEAEIARYVQRHARSAVFQALVSHHLHLMAADGTAERQVLHGDVQWRRVARRVA